MDCSGLPIKELNELILAAGRISSAHEFFSFTMNGLQRFVSCDQGTAYSFNSCGKVSDWYLQNVSLYWNKTYLEYYEQFLNREKPGPLSGVSPDDSCFREIDWSRVIEDPLPEYIRDRGIKHSFYLMMDDDNQRTRAVIALDRITDTPLNKRERDCLRFLAPHLNISHKRFLSRAAPDADGGDRKSARMKAAGLTRQETRIALQLCAGVSPANISRALNISPTTTRKHIAHIYGKMRVSNIQELLISLLASESSGLNRTK